MGKKKKGGGKTGSSLVMKIVTPKKMIMVEDLKDLDDILMVDVIDHKNGHKLGTFKLSVAKLKFSF